MSYFMLIIYCYRNEQIKLRKSAALRALSRYRMSCWESSEIQFVVMTMKNPLRYKLGNDIKLDCDL